MKNLLEVKTTVSTKDVVAVQISQSMFICPNAWLYIYFKEFVLRLTKFYYKGKVSLKDYLIWRKKWGKYEKCPMKIFCEEVTKQIDFGVFFCSDCVCNKYRKNDLELLKLKSLANKIYSKNNSVIKIVEKVEMKQIEIKVVESVLQSVNLSTNIINSSVGGESMDIQKKDSFFYERQTVAVNVGKEIMVIIAMLSVGNLDSGSEERTKIRLDWYKNEARQSKCTLLPTCEMILSSLELSRLSCCSCPFRDFLGEKQAWVSKKLKKLFPGSNEVSDAEEKGVISVSPVDKNGRIVWPLPKNQEKVKKDDEVDPLDYHMIVSGKINYMNKHRRAEAIKIAKNLISKDMKGVGIIQKIDGEFIPLDMTELLREDEQVQMDNTLKDEVIEKGKMNSDSWQGSNDTVVTPVSTRKVRGCRTFHLTVNGVLKIVRNMLIKDIKEKAQKLKAEGKEVSLQQKTRGNLIDIVIPEWTEKLGIKATGRKVSGHNTTSSVDKRSWNRNPLHRIVFSDGRPDISLGKTSPKDARNKACIWVNNPIVIKKSNVKVSLIKILKSGEEIQFFSRDDFKQGTVIPASFPSRNYKKRQVVDSRKQIVNRDSVDKSKNDQTAVISNEPVIQEDKFEKEVSIGGAIDSREEIFYLEIDGKCNLEIEYTLELAQSQVKNLHSQGRKVLVWKKDGGDIQAVKLADMFGEKESALQPDIQTGTNREDNELNEYKLEFAAFISSENIGRSSEVYRRNVAQEGADKNNCDVKLIEIDLKTGNEKVVDIFSPDNFSPDTVSFSKEKSDQKIDKRVDLDGGEKALLITALGLSNDELQIQFLQFVFAEVALGVTEAQNIQAWERGVPGKNGSHDCFLCVEQMGMGANPIGIMTYDEIVARDKANMLLPAEMKLWCFPMSGRQVIAHTRAQKAREISRFNKALESKSNIN